MWKCFEVFLVFLSGRARRPRQGGVLTWKDSVEMGAPEPLKGSLAGGEGELLVKVINYSLCFSD